VGWKKKNLSRKTKQEGQQKKPNNNRKGGKVYSIEATAEGARIIREGGGERKKSGKRLFDY